MSALQDLLASLQMLTALVLLILALGSISS